MSITTAPIPIPIKRSPAPWGYEYSPYSAHPIDGGPEVERLAFEVFDNDGNKVFDTNEDASPEQQEANARMAVAAPALLAAVQAFLAADALATECGEWKWENLDEAFWLAREAMAFV